MMRTAEFSGYFCIFVCMLTLAKVFSLVHIQKMLNRTCLKCEEDLNTLVKAFNAQIPSQNLNNLGVLGLELLKQEQEHGNVSLSYLQGLKSKFLIFQESFRKLGIQRSQAQFQSFILASIPLFVVSIQCMISPAKVNFFLVTEFGKIVLFSSFSLFALGVYCLASILLYFENKMWTSFPYLFLLPSKNLPRMSSFKLNKSAAKNAIEFQVFFLESLLWQVGWKELEREILECFCKVVRNCIASNLLPKLYSESYTVKVALLSQSFNWHAFDKLNSFLSNISEKLEEAFALGLLPQEVILQLQKEASLNLSYSLKKSFFKLPTLLLIPSVFFLFPAALLLILGEALQELALVVVA